MLTHLITIENLHMKESESGLLVRAQFIDEKLRYQRSQDDSNMLSVLFQ